MIFYLATDQEGYRHLLTRKDEAAKLDPDYKSLDIEPNKEAMQIALQELLTEADEARRNSSVTDVSDLPNVIACPEPKDSHMGCPTCHGRWYVRIEKPTEPSQPDPTRQSIDLDAAFAAAPVPHQLDLAALAMENARQEIIDYDCKLKTLAPKAGNADG